MEWDIRVFKEPDGQGYSLREVFYGRDGTIRAYDADPIGTEASLDDLLDYVRAIVSGLDAVRTGEAPLLEACDDDAQETLIVARPVKR
jgi:hypothetical protein